MRILVTNDDGIHAEGLKVLEGIARTFSDDVWVVAPETEQSGAGHSLTMHQPLRMRRVDDMHFAVNGTPTDCVLMAVMQIIGGPRPDLLLSGINLGLNVAEDVTYSGTIAAAMEGTLLDIPSIAFSTRVKNPDVLEWDAPRHFAPGIIRTLLDASWSKGNLMNVNFPGIPLPEVQGVKVCPQGRRKIAEKLHKNIDPKGRPYFWIGGPGDTPYDDLPGADYMQLHKGFVTVTPLCMDMTNYKLLEDVRERFESQKAPDAA